MARPSDYDPKHHPHIVQELAHKGMTEEMIAKTLGISRATLSNWKIKHPALLDALKEGKIDPDDEVEAALLRKAKGFSYAEAGKQRTSLPDTVACIFWLKNRRPALWRDKHEAVVDLTVRGKPVEDIDPADIAVLERLRRLQLDGDD